MTDREKIRVVALYGPTAVGKSSVALEMALALNGEIVSADSMQVYQGLPVLTDQPAAAMLAAAPHHLVGMVPLNEEYNAVRFARDAGAAISGIAGREALPLLVGGTGLYIRALLGDFSFSAGSDPEVRRRWEEFIRIQGAAAACAELQRLDPEAFGAVDTNNPRRLVRALEAAETDGLSLTGERGRQWSADSPFRVLSFGLDADREELYAGIECRVDDMLQGAALAEVAAALGGNVSRTVAQAIGFKEVAAHLRGELSLADAAALIKQRTRRYAKRQLTWMRKMPDIVKIDMAGRDAAQAASEIIGRVRLAGFIS
ncbi:MAG: tRNA (adenosine(37)-N6)-dimethylallyltransferase MiaA [Thermoleophilia bacterium]